MGPVRQLWLLGWPPPISAELLFRRPRFLSGLVSSHPEKDCLQHLPENRSAVVWFRLHVSRTFSFPKDASLDVNSRLAVFCHVCAMYADMLLSVTAEKQFPGI